MPMPKNPMVQNIMNSVYQNTMNRISPQLQGIQQQMQGRGQLMQQQTQSPMDILRQMKAQGMSVEQAYQQLMQNPQIAQSINKAKQKYPNMTYAEIAQKTGYDMDDYKI